MKIYLNTIYRISPVVLVYLIFIVIIVISWTQGFYLLFSPYIYEFRTFFETMLSISYRRFYEEEEFKQFISDRDFSYMGLAALLLFWTQIMIIIFFIALVTHLFKKASGFEKGNDVITPEKELLFRELKEIKDKIDQIYHAKVKGSEEGVEATMQFKNTKIIVWLLNRNKEHMRDEREDFFNTVNLELREEHAAEQEKKKA